MKTINIINLILTVKILIIKTNKMKIKKEKEIIENPFYMKGYIGKNNTIGEGNYEECLNKLKKLVIKCTEKQNLRNKKDKKYSDECNNISRENINFIHLNSDFNQIRDLLFIEKDNKTNEYNIYYKGIEKNDKLV